MWWLSVHKYHIFNRRQCLYLGKCYLQIWTDYMNWFQSAYSPVRVWFPIWCYAVHLSLTSKCLTQYLRRISICYPGVSLQLRGLDFFSGRRIWTSAGGRCTWQEVLNNIKMEKRRLSTCYWSMENLSSWNMPPKYKQFPWKVCASLQNLLHSQLCLNGKYSQA